ncbi:MAG: hypothetical protein KJ645_00250, partial [Planctomycetes bacterium]|nr:hypothetical protein [Planctomycetota bacterium]
HFSAADIVLYREIYRSGPMVFAKLGYMCEPMIIADDFKRHLVLRFKIDIARVGHQHNKDRVSAFL